MDWRTGVRWLDFASWLVVSIGTFRSSDATLKTTAGRLVGGIMLADADCVCWDWALALGSTRSSSCLAAEVQKPSSCLAEEIQLLVERLGSLLSLCHQAAWWH